MKITIPFNARVRTPNGVGIAKERYLVDGEEYRLVCHKKRNFTNKGAGRPLYQGFDLSKVGNMVFWLYEHKEVK